MITFGHENLTVSNMERAIAFYEEQFGMVVTARMNDTGGEKMAWLAFSPEENFFLELTEKPVRPGSGHIAFVTDAWDTFYEKHRAAGLISVLECVGVYFLRDPDGNDIEVMSYDAVKKFGAMGS